MGWNKLGTLCVLLAQKQILTDMTVAAAPVVYTSYDYSAPLRETRQIQDKMYQTKLIGMFTRVSKDLLKTYMVGNGTGYAVRAHFQIEFQNTYHNPDHI